VHSNLEALTAVLEAIDGHKPDRLFFVGDAVGYGPNPNECIDKIYEVSDCIVAGNHDHAAVGLFDIGFFNPFAAHAIRWTQSVLSNENRERLLAMPLARNEDGCFIVHASPDRPEHWSYLYYAAEAAYQFEFFEETVCLVGHTHRPAIYVNDGGNVFSVQERMLTFQKGFRYIVNVGSVGQPRDGNPDATFAVYDRGEEILSFHRVSYDYRATQEKMRAAHLPSFLVDRLESGT
jgi:diadenosine tetraphosphatase ApaH/serine/threonine PP2A family protein phosphatase